MIPDLLHRNSNSGYDCKKNLYLCIHFTLFECVAFQFFIDPHTYWSHPRVSINHTIFFAPSITILEHNKPSFQLSPCAFEDSTIELHLGTCQQCPIALQTVCGASVLLGLHYDSPINNSFIPGAFPPARLFRKLVLRSDCLPGLKGVCGGETILLACTNSTVLSPNPAGD